MMLTKSDARNSTTTATAGSTRRRASVLAAVMLIAALSGPLRAQVRGVLRSGRTGVFVEARYVEFFGVPE